MVRGPVSLQLAGPEIVISSTLVKARVPSFQRGRVGILRAAQPSALGPGLASHLLIDEIRTLSLDPFDAYGSRWTQTEITTGLSMEIHNAGRTADVTCRHRAVPRRKRRL
jgi:hypothetical protein